MNDFIQQLLNDSNLPDSTSPEVKKELAKELEVKAYELINRRLIESMSDKDAEEFFRLIESDPENQVAAQKFIEDHVKDQVQIVSAALIEFRVLYLGEKAVS